MLKSIFSGALNDIRHGSRLRKFNTVMNCLSPAPQDTLLEVGVANREYSRLDNFLVKNYPYRNRITALGIGDLDLFRKNYPEVRTISYAGRAFPFKDRQFDIAHSNAVIEHVGASNEQTLFLKEMCRVSRRGMITTPNRFFPVETHTNMPFVHWLGKEKSDSVLKLVGKQWATGDYMHLLGFKDLDSIAKKAGLKNYRIIRNRFFGFTMTFTMIWFNE